MTTAGEQQYYSLALLIKLFAHLPVTYRMGILYDIGCQLHRSCFKWDFLPAFRERITFAISVFHAYGHQWPCQLVYHPRKCEGFGLSDGEGCERFWSAIDHLVPGLRISGVSLPFRLIDYRPTYLSETVPSAILCVRLANHAPQQRSSPLPRNLACEEIRGV
jgi:hypothetical protein